MTPRRYRGAGSALEDTALVLKKTTINAWIAATKVAGGAEADAESRAAVTRMVDLLQQDAASMTFARTHGRAGAPAPRRVPRRESMLTIARRAAEEGDDPYGLVSAPEQGAAVLVRDLGSLLDGDAKVAVTLDRFLAQMHRVAASLATEPGERLTRL